ALAAGRVTRQELRTRFVKLHHNVYAPIGMPIDAAERARAAWLWSRREAAVAGLSAAALLGARWLPGDAPAELARTRATAAPGIVVHRGAIAGDELCLVQSVDCTTAARTAYDIGRRTSGDAAVVRIDSLLNATRCAPAAIAALAARYPGARGTRQLRAALDLVDGGAESPQETALRLVLIRAGLPRPVTQIPVRDHRGTVVRRIDMGWPRYLVGVEYDGGQHWTDPDVHAEDIDRLEFLAARGWLIVRVSSRQLRRSPGTVAERAGTALRQRGRTSP
ncbi:MAG: hypothetical protein SW019_07300, partial [Actinomycetota bacterium]|nr:hypothetical protein [Actinomycetota bacterium]